MGDISKYEFWKKELETKTIEKIGDIDESELAINDWGSCQYSGALAFFNTYSKIRKDLSIPETFQVLDIRINLDDLNKYIDHQPIPYDQDVKIRFCSDYIDFRMKGGYDFDILTDNLRMLLDILRDTKTFDEFFKILNDNSYDLWTASEDVFKATFPDIIIENVKDAPGFGPILNQLVQHENYRTGLYCALLVDLGAVKDPNSFAGFDT